MSWAILILGEENCVRNKRMAASKPRKPGEVYLGKSGKFEHIVKEGEDIVSIAIRYGLSPSALMDFNNLKSSDLAPNVVLRIPSHS